MRYVGIALLLCMCCASVNAEIRLIDDIRAKNDAFVVMVRLGYVGDAATDSCIDMDADGIIDPRRLINTTHADFDGYFLKYFNTGDSVGLAEVVGGSSYDWLDSALANAGYGLQIDGTNDSLEIDSTDIEMWLLWGEAYDSVAAWLNLPNDNRDSVAVFTVKLNTDTWGIDHNADSFWVDHAELADELITAVYAGDGLSGGHIAGEATISIIVGHGLDLASDSIWIDWTEVDDELITGVTAGDGLTGDATEGTATLAVGAGTGITVNANDVEIATDGVDDTHIDWGVTGSEVSGADLPDETLGDVDIASSVWSVIGGQADTCDGGAIRAETCKLADSTDGGAIRSETCKLADSTDGGAIRAETTKLADSTDGGAIRSETCKEADSTDGGAIRSETTKGWTISAADPTTDAEGEFAWDSDDNTTELNIDGDSSVLVVPWEWEFKTIVEPDSVQATIDAPIIMSVPATLFPHGITVVALGIAWNTDITATVNFEEWDDPQDGSPENIDGVSTSAADEAEDTDIFAPDVAAGSYICADLQAATGATELHLWIKFYIKEGD